MNLNLADYSYIKSLVGELIEGLPTVAVTVDIGANLYRGIIYNDKKPNSVQELKYPPVHKVHSYQRCNSPQNPMFYCSHDDTIPLYELDVKAGHTVYLANWKVVNHFFSVHLFENSTKLEGIPEKKALDFFRKMFSTKAQPSISNTYKITSALSEILINAFINESQLPVSGMWGGIIYPSTVHPKLSENLAIKPEICDACLELQYVREIKILSVDGCDIRGEYTDFSNDFEKGEINWTGKNMHFYVHPGESFSFAHRSMGNIDIC